MSFKNSKILFYNAIKNCTLKYYSFNGRAIRSEYWIWTILTAIVSTLLFSIDISIGMYIGESDEGLLSTFFQIIILLPSLTVSVRRLHDVNKSGWWILIWFTVIGIIPLIYWHCCKSFQETNKYGPVPNI
jgi:uncharacterized membrane protein YhaH (DUF805 family)